MMSKTHVLILFKSQRAIFMSNSTTYKDTLVVFPQDKFLHLQTVQILLIGCTEADAPVSQLTFTEQEACSGEDPT